MKKFLVLMLALVVLSTALIGCKKDEAENNESAEELPLYKLEDEGVYINEALFFVFDMQGQYEAQFGEDVMSQPYGEGTVADMVKAQALESSIAISLTAYEAEKTGITLTDEEKKVETDQAKIYFDGMDADAILQYGFTLEMIENVFLKYALRNKYMVSQEPVIPIDEVALKATLDEIALTDAYYASIVKYGVEESAISVRAKHILIQTVDSAGAPLSEELVSEARAKIEEALARANAGEDFATLVSEYSQDGGSLETGGEYTFARGEFVPEFEAAAYSMTPGQISDIVETDYGFHIIKLEEKDIPATEENIQKRKDYEAASIEKAKSAQTQVYFEQKYTEWKEKYAVTINNQMWQAVYVKGLTGAPAATDATTTEAETEATTESK